MIKHHIPLATCATAFVLVTALACSGLTELDAATGEGAVTTDASACVATPVPGTGTQVQYQFTVITTFRNTGTSTLHLGCTQGWGHPMYSVRVATSDTAAAAYDPAWLAIACATSAPQLTIAPSAARVDTLTLRGPNAWDGQTHAPRGVMEGTFQVVYAADGCNASGGCRSNPFTVRLAP